MPDLTFRIESANIVPYAMAPTLAFRLAITNVIPDEPIHTIALRCQIQIDVSRRRYAPEEQDRLLDLFGTPDRWSQTLRGLLWTNISLVVPAFTGTGTVTDLQIPCTFDFNIAATKYFGALKEGDIPLNILFSGTVFYAAPGGDLQVAPIPWDREASFRLPVKVWREMMDFYYPNSVWVNLRRDVFDRLYLHKMQRSLPTWEQALEELLDAETSLHSGTGQS